MYTEDVDRRATGVKNGNVGPKLHWRLWRKSGFPALPCERYVLPDIKGHGGNIWAKRQLFLTYRLYTGAKFNKWQSKDGFAPIEYNVEVGPAPGTGTAVRYLP